MNKAAQAITAKGRTHQQYEEMEAAFIQFLIDNEEIEDEDDSKLDWENRISPAHPYCNGSYKHQGIRLAFKVWIELWFEHPHHKEGKPQ